MCIWSMYLCAEIHSRVSTRGAMALRKSVTGATSDPGGGCVSSAVSSFAASAADEVWSMGGMLECPPLDVMRTCDTVCVIWVTYAV